MSVSESCLLSFLCNPYISFQIFIYLSDLHVAWLSAFQQLQIVKDFFKEAELNTEARYIDTLYICYVNVHVCTVPTLYV